MLHSVRHYASIMRKYFGNNTRAARAEPLRVRTTSSVCGGSATGGAEGDNSSSEDGDVDGRPANAKTPTPSK